MQSNKMKDKNGNILELHSHVKYEKVENSGIFYAGIVIELNSPEHKLLIQEDKSTNIVAGRTWCKSRQVIMKPVKPVAAPAPAPAPACPVVGDGRDIYLSLIADAIPEWNSKRQWARVSTQLIMKPVIPLVTFHKTKPKYSIDYHIVSYDWWCDECKGDLTPATPVATPAADAVAIADDVLNSTNTTATLDINGTEKEFITFNHLNSLVNDHIDKYVEIPTGAAPAAAPSVDVTNVDFATTPDDVLNEFIDQVQGEITEMLDIDETITFSALPMKTAIETAIKLVGLYETIDVKPDGINNIFSVFATGLIC